MKKTWLLAFLLFLAHALLLGPWIVDDAGISFAYARNLAAGHGLVSQPGLPPVEGFSNFLWTMALSLTFLVRLFNPVLTPKILSLALVGGSFFLLDRSLENLTGRRAVSRTVLILLAVCTPFVIWTVSGLENPLYIFLLCLLLWLIVREQAGLRRHLPFAAGAVVAAVAMTRPDGILFAALYPLLTPFADRSRAALRRIVRYGIAMALILGGFLLFRWLYFGDLVPNTYYAKGGPSSRAWLDLVTFQRPMVGKVFDLFESLAGPLNGLLAVGILAGTVFLIGRHRFRREHGTLLAFAWFGATPFLLLPFDWMPEFRFATPFFPFLYAYAGALAASLGEMLVPDPDRRRLPALVTAVLAVGLSLVLFAPRTVLFAAAPTVPFDLVMERFGLRYNRFSDMLGLRQASILLPDAGGTLWASHLRVYDLVGLTDPVIARTLDKRPKAFFDYVFERTKPTFIHTHHYWTLKAGFDYDSRFTRDYVALFDFMEPAVVQRAQGYPLRSGDFVRRDAIVGKDAEVAVIRAEIADYYRQERPLAEDARPEDQPR